MFDGRCTSGAKGPMGYLGEFEQLIPFSILRLGDDAYGVSIREKIEERTGRAVSVGAIYTALGRLLADGATPKEAGAAMALVTARQAADDPEVYAQRLGEVVEMPILVLGIASGPGGRVSRAPPALHPVVTEQTADPPVVGRHLVDEDGRAVALLPQDPHDGIGDLAHQERLLLPCGGADDVGRARSRRVLLLGHREGTVEPTTWSAANVTRDSCQSWFSG
jgi:hypothetical protein